MISRLTDARRSRLVPYWPSVAAGFAALVGMGSCAVTVSFVRAPGAFILAIVIAAFIFWRLLPLVRSDQTQEESAKALGRAWRVSWLTSVVAGWWLGATLGRSIMSSEGGSPTNDDGGGGFIGAVIGLLAGASIAAAVRAIGKRYLRKRGDDPSDASEVR